jgi:DNA topoisomerase-1
LVIVESPAKARTIAKYLGSGFIVESSIGHIRDLPSTASEIPAEVKDEPWARIGVNVEDNFRPLYIVPARKKAQVTKLRQLARKAQTLYLATDEDREGEAIAWHLLETLQPKVPVKRMVFDEITQQAIQEALAHPRDVDMQLVNAQEARRILDRLYGYEVSPVLWRKIAPKLSAGRVQSVATRLIVDRERERMRFRTAEYWDVEATLESAARPDLPIQARLIELNRRRVATGKDFNGSTGQLKAASEVVALDANVAKGVAEHLASATFAVTEVTEKPFTQRALPPFITSSLQQEASRQLRLTAQRTMRLAQQLYENGYITYMRTDSTHLSSQAINAARSQAVQLYGQEYVPDQPRHYTRKAKGAQEAHEAIRPAGAEFRTPKEVEKELDPAAFKLYELIWKRTLACQMKDATGRRTSVRIGAEPARTVRRFSARRAR